MAFLLFRTRSKRRIPNILLGIHFLIVGIQMTGHFFSYFLFDTARYSQYNSALALSLPPLLYLYIRVLFSERKWKFSTSYLAHFIPTTAGIFIGLNNIILPPEHRSILYISGMAYILPIAIFLQSKSQKWDITNHKMYGTYHWGKTLTYLFGLVLLADALFFVGFRFFGNYLLLIETGVMLTVLTYTIYPMLKLLNSETRWDVFGFPIQQQSLIGVNSELSPNSDLLLQLQNHMNSAMPYVNPELTLADVSKTMNLTTRELSELINGNLGKNFVSYVNSYRINMAKQLLLNPRETNLTISEIMYEVGFSSRSSFNTLFKKETGMTPSEFRAGYINRSLKPKVITQQLQ